MNQKIAIVGVSALFPGSVDKTGFYKDILEGTDRMTDVPPTHWLVDDYYDPDPSTPDKTYAKRGGFLGDVEFDPMEWGVPPTSVPSTDTCQLLALIVARQVLDDATRGRFAQMDRSRTSVILGVTSAQELLTSMVSRLQRPVWVKALRETGLPEDEVQKACERIEAHYVPWQETSFPGVLGNVVAGRIANRLDLGGTNCVTDAACASTFSAVSMAVNELRLGESDLVIAGGADTMNDIFMYMCFSKTPALSKSGDCRPFSDNADGTMLGEGFGMVALKRLEDAERDGDRVYAVIAGVGSSSDGRAKSVYAPLPEGQAKAIRRAHAIAGFDGSTIELVEAHGTGTAAGDAAEFEGLRSVFDESGRKDRQWCALGSVKSQIGHTKAAAGAAGLVKAVFALHHKVLPPTIKIDRPNPALELEKSPFHLNTRARPWVRDASHPRRAGVSSFGFGGSNFHLALEEYVGPAERAPRLRVSPTELVLVAGANATEVARSCREIAASPPKEGLLRFLARETQEKFDASRPARLAIVAKDEAELFVKLGQAASLLEREDKPFSLPGGIDFASGEPTGPVAFVFPGQGSQYVDMGASLAMTYDAARAPWDRAAGLRLAEGEALHDVVFPRPVFDEAGRTAQSARLTRTEWAQPAIGAASLACLGVLDLVGLTPTAVAGHSFGELTALAAAGVLSTDDLLRVARKRGELMAAASKTAGSGTMTAVTATREIVERHIAETKLDVTIANHNAPEQVVLSGRPDAIERAEAHLEAAGVRCRRIQVATAFHSPIVASSAGPFTAFLETVPFAQAKPGIRTYANSTATQYPTDAPPARALLGAQLAKPVRFVEQIEAMYADGARVFLEVGPSSVLTSFVSKILAGRPHRAIAMDVRDVDDRTALHLALGRLAVAGVPLRLDALWSAFERTPDPRAAAPKRTLKLNGSNYGKPYPPPGGAAALPKPNPPRPVPVALAAPSPVRTAAPAPSPKPATPNVATPSNAQSRWLEAFQELQRQTAETHAYSQRAMAENHAAFLKTAETAMLGLATMVGGRMPEGAAISARPSLARASQPADSGLSMPARVSQPADSGVPLPVVAPPPAAAVAPVRAAVVAPAPVAPARDLRALMLGIVAEKTGYPVDMLAMDMALEADLGIDSIKRVEILAAIQKAAPDLPKVERSVLAGMRTLGQIAEYLEQQVGATPSPAPAASPARPTRDLRTLMLGIVAEKTGYPVDMLTMDMALEADLGIDSIKRVEILAAIQKAAPDLPKVERSVLAGMRTLRQIAEYFEQHAGTTPAASPATSSPKRDLRALMLGIVADKTGYPVDMLTMDMALEADLGIDSIKRVEILAAIQKAAPDLPKVERSVLAGMRTLGQIAEYFEGKANGGNAPVHHELAAAPPTTSAELGRFVVEAVRSPATGFAMRSLPALRRVSVSRDGAVADEVVRLLRAAGIAAHLDEQPTAETDGVVFLGGLRDAATPAEASKVAREAFRWARAVAPRFESGRGVFVTVQDTGGSFGIGSPARPERAWLGGLSGLTKTAAQEWPAVDARAIDLARADRAPTEIARAVVSEILAGGAGLEVGLCADGTRTTLRSVAAKSPSFTTPPNAPPVLVATGGGRGVTAACLVALAAKTRCKLALFGRTALTDEPSWCAEATTEVALKHAFLDDAARRGEKTTPAILGTRVAAVLAAREIRATLAAIASAGGEARYVAVDAQDAGAMKSAVDDVRRAWGPITGVVHGAGVLADRKIAEKTDEQFDRVFDTKVVGLANLLAATEGDPLDVLCMFSSIAARTGNAGQCDYAMANEILNKVASAEKQRRGGTLRVRSINWGPWAGGMVTPDLAARFGSRGVPLLALDAGATAFVDELYASGPHDPVEVVIGPTPSSRGEGADVLDLVVDRAAYPQLDHHRIRGVAVVPVVLALEWCARAARVVRPDLVVAGCRDLQVLRGIRLPSYDDGATWLSVRLRKIGETVFEATLVDDRERPHYRATVHLAEQLGTADAKPAPLDTLDPFRSAIYGGPLFHGPEFQVIRTLEGVSTDGIAGSLVGTAECGWPEAAWETDPALLDGGLQLALLWTRHRLGGASLPTGIASYERYVHGPAKGPLRGVLLGEARSEEVAVSDVSFVDQDGSIVATLRGVSTTLLPIDDTASAEA